ncbi:MAG TPA: YraN family protein [Stackebrandtia sp.]|uniref:YraN family protein n=1 Tax=Stackebrandtia sp. TaxID=2023065 RepID=UPI002D438287|nr:YraN family protein [Stackebrandtia sp.]HZE39257.1 YraN family protein [Stackebrandtia sp.]
MAHVKDRRELGALGEELAAAHLRRDGMRIVARNWRCRSGELDIVAARGATVVVCEVKTRRSVRCGTPAAAIDADKARRVRELALLWRNESRRAWRRMRIDAVCVLVGPDGTASIDHRRGVV